jgi:hypothetical protein
MEVIFRFFDKENWSIYATINCAIILTLLVITKQKIDLQTLIIVSLMGMMQGDILSKMIFTGFLSILLFNKSMEWFTKTAVFLGSNIITSNIPYNNDFQKLIVNNTILLWLFRLLIVAWFFYIFNLMRKK